MGRKNKKGAEHCCRVIWSQTRKQEGWKRFMARINREGMLRRKQQELIGNKNEEIDKERER